MNRPTEQQSLETLAKAIASIPTFKNALFEAAWRYIQYEQVRLETVHYIESRDNNRPTKKREQLVVDCAHSYERYNSTANALNTIAKSFGPISANTVNYEVWEIVANADMQTLYHAAHC